MKNAITGETIHLYDYLKEEIPKATEIKFMVAFLRESGVKLLINDLKKVAANDVPIKILTGTYLNITEPSALYYLKKELKNKVDIRIFDDELGFNPKAYLINQGKEGVMFIGSSNVSKPGLTYGLEWNFRLDKALSPNDYRVFEARFDKMFNERAIKLDDRFLRQYSLGWKKPIIYPKKPKVYEVRNELIATPKGFQIEALYELQKAREHALRTGIVVVPAGMGKTHLAVFDSMEFDKVLFVARRKEHLEHARSVFLKLRPDKTISFYHKDRKDFSGDIVIADAKTLGDIKNLSSIMLDPLSFDYIVFDEFHKEIGEYYENIYEYFEPKFLLGIINTPFKRDYRQMFEFCNDHIIYEINLKNSINRNLLVPFKYYGIYDDSDYLNVEYKYGKYDEEKLLKVLLNVAKANFVYDKYMSFKGKKTIAFCYNKEHAIYMRDFFNDHNIRSKAVYTKISMWDSLEDGLEVGRELESGKLDVIFWADSLSDDVYIPCADTVIFLSPIDSYSSYLHQLGKCLGKYEDKDFLKIVDFIGNYKKAYYIPKLLTGRNPIANYDFDYLDIHDKEYPASCSIHFDFNLMNILKNLNDEDDLKSRVRDEYFRIAIETSSRPMRLDIFEGSDIDFKYFRPDGYIEFLNSLDQLTQIEKTWLNERAVAFLNELERVSISESYKIPVLISVLNYDDEDNFEASFNHIVNLFIRFYRSSKLRRIDLPDYITQDFEKWQIDDFKEIALKGIKEVCRSEFLEFCDENRSIKIDPSLKKFMNEDFKNHMRDIIMIKEIKYFRLSFKN